MGDTGIKAGPAHPRRRMTSCVFTGWQGLSPAWWPPGHSEHGSCISQATRQTGNLLGWTGRT